MSVEELVRRIESDAVKRRISGDLETTGEKNENHRR